MIKLFNYKLFFRENKIFNLDFNISTLLEQAEHFDQWTESLSGKIKIYYLYLIIIKIKY